MDNIQHTGMRPPCGLHTSVFHHIFVVTHLPDMPGCWPSTICLHLIGRLCQRAPSRPTNNRPQSPIHTLNGDVLLNIFYLYRLDNPDEGQDEDGVFVFRWNRQRWWYKLAQVCQRWRYLILASPSRLDLQLVCTYGTPVADMLAHSPPLPLTINYENDGRETTVEDEEGILLALQHRDRVRRIRLILPASRLQNLVTAIDEQFPILERVWIGSQTEGDGVVLPRTFQAPHLRRLGMWNVALPMRSPLLTTSVGLTALSLGDISPSFYFPPLYLLTRLSLLPQLESLTICFHSPLPNLDVERHLLDIPNTTHVTLPNLGWFRFRGVSAYLEGLLARIDAPVLSNLLIVFFNQLTFTVPRLLDFMHASENFSLSAVRLEFIGDGFVLRRDYREKPMFGPFYLKVLCRHLDWQVSSAGQILSALQPVLSSVEQLTLSHGEHNQSLDWHNEVDHTQWRELLRPFSNVKTLHVQNELMEKLSRSLRSEGEQEQPLELPPNLEELGYSGGGNAFTPLAIERQFCRLRPGREPGTVGSSAANSQTGRDVRNMVLLLPSPPALFELTSAYTSAHTTSICSSPINTHTYSSPGPIHDTPVI
ncbi:hypothetical protein BJV78DRAFT_1156085 [Lactifluus subvellereus]|nr:hypothetical protein BJV78DRAFT_1156085 [Lactifluus subvellereus]